MATPYCLICHNIYVQTEEIASTPCGHVYHHDCLGEWLNTSQTCPQCRKDCMDCQTKRIFIDFADDDDLACAQIIKDTRTDTTNSDAEETIKILLEHIENGPTKQHQSNERECDFCKEFQETYDNVVTDKDLMAVALRDIERENGDLLNNNQNAMKLIEKLEMEIRAHEHNLREIKEQLKTSEAFTAAIQLDNVQKQHIIDDLNSIIRKNTIELNEMRTQMQDINDKMHTMTIKHATEMKQICQGLQNIFHGNYQQHLLKFYCKQTNENCKLDSNQQREIDTSDKDLKGFETNECRALVPYCGDINSWNYMMVPILRKSHT